MLGKTLGSAVYYAETCTEYLSGPYFRLEKAQEIEFYGRVFRAVLSVFSPVSPQKLIFLDLDETMRLRTKESEAAEDAAFQSDPVSYFMNENGPLNQRAVENLDFLLEKVPDAYIIMTSDWIKGRTVQTLRNHALAKYKFSDRIYDKIVETLDERIAYDLCQKYAPEFIVDAEQQTLLPEREEENRATKLYSEEELESWKEKRESALQERYQSLGLNDNERNYIPWTQIRNNFIKRSLKILDALETFPKAEFVIFDDIFLEHFKKHHLFNPQYVQEVGVFRGRFIHIHHTILLTRGDVMKAIDIFQREKVAV